MVQVRKVHEGTSVTIKAQHYETGNWWRYGDGHYGGTILSFGEVGGRGVGMSDGITEEYSGRGSAPSALVG